VKDPQRDTVAFTPYATIKDVFGLSVFLILYAWLVFYVPNYLLDADNSVPANPLATPAHVVPEWYLLPFYAMLRAIPSKLWGVVIMGSAIVVLAVHSLARPLAGQVGEYSTARPIAFSSGSLSRSALASATSARRNRPRGWRSSRAS